MNRCWLSVAVVISFVAGSTAFADIPGNSRRPIRGPVQPEPVPVTIKYEQVSKKHPAAEARIVIPKRLLAEIAKQHSVYTGAGSGDEPSSFPWTTVVAGIALSLAAASGVWVIRRREARLVATAALLVVVSCGAWNLAHGDLLVPGAKGPKGPPRQPVKPNGPQQERPTILIETTDDGDSVTLILRPKAE